MILVKSNEDDDKDGIPNSIDLCRKTTHTGVLFIHGVITNIVVGIPPNYMLAQLIGITIVGVYYYNFIPLYERKEIISLYLKICLFVAIIGYPMYFLNINLNDGRLQSIFKEPAHYVVVVLPSCYYFFKL